jgi:peptide/nickel transport system ATP-binding protein
MAMLLITHDLGVAASVADRVVVMYAGRIVEEAPARTLFANPRHPYTRGLLRSVIGHDQARNTPLYSIDGSVPDLAHLPAECRFRPRCPRAAARCATERPPLERLGESLVACWRPDPAPLDADPGRPSATMIKLRTAEAPPLAWASDVKKDYPLGGGWLGRGRGAIRAVDGVSLEVRTGETLGLVGESGSGKSTLGRLLLGLEHPTSGRIAVEGQDLAALDTEGLRAQRRHMQMIFQDPYGSLDPRWTIGDSVAEPLRIYESLSRAERRTRVQDLLEQVGLDARWEGRFPHQLSGGQRQRVAIARAIALNPRFVVADEAVSALDVSVRAQIINLLETVKARLGLTYLFIGHELNLVRHVSDRVAVMYLGRLVEIGLADEVLRRPAHHYTRALIAAIPQLDTTRAEAPVPVDGEIPSAGVVARGCGFASRCAAATVVCHAEAPELLTVAAEHAAACHHPL